MQDTRDVHAMRPENCNPKPATDLYVVVPDGTKFAIARKGKVILHGMELEKALETAAILNSVMESEQTS